MSVLGMLAWLGAAVSLWLGARRSPSAFARGYLWLAGAAVLSCAGLVVQEVAGAALSPASGLVLADLPTLLAVAAAAVGMVMLATAEREAEAVAPGAQRPGRAEGADASQGAAGSVLPGLADGYVLAVALLVIGWVTLFSAEFHRSGDRPGTFLLVLSHVLADLAVLGALLPMVTAGRRRVLLPYLSLVAVTIGDALAVGQRALGGHAGVATQLMAVVAALLLAAAPWWAPGTSRTRRTSGSAAATLIAALAAVVATLVVIGNGLAAAPASGVALVVAGGAAVLVLAVRVFMLVRENAVILGVWRQSSQSLRDLASQTSDVVLVCDIEGVISYASPAVGAYGYAPADLTGRRLLDFVHPEDRAAARASSRLALGGRASGGRPGPATTPAVAAAGTAGAAAGTPGAPASPGGGGPLDASAAGSWGRFPVRVRAADGTWRHVESTVLRYQAPGDVPQARFRGGPGGSPPGVRILVTVRDVSDQVALRQQVTYLTFHDGLTGLPNRAYVEERTRDVLRDAAVGRLGVIFLDLDRFTEVNDSVGHGAGDLVLAQAARRLRAIVPAHDTVARWGSDEFAVLVEHAASDPDVSEIAERLVGAVAAEPFRVADQQITLTASAGVALAEAGPTTPASPGSPDTPPGLVLRNADVAMSRAKEEGGDRVETYAAHMHADVVRKLEMVTDLQRAIGNGELTLQYQPVVDLATSRVVGAEALVRWRREGQVIPPRDFLGAAEESGLIVPLGEWVLREACARGAAWRPTSPDVGVSVNLSGRQLTAPGFTGLVAAILVEAGLPPGALTIEVNERILVEGNGQIVDRLADLRRQGIRIAIDNFGTGYAALAHLRQLPLDAIKIDPSFVAGLGHDDTLTLLTRTVVQLGRDLGLQVIAEGIEQPRQLSALREMGCGYGQGFGVAGPMAATALEAMIRASADAADDPREHPVSECETTHVIG
jgi:diguanylate cyclase (GGDEF)-like protein